MTLVNDFLNDLTRRGYSRNTIRSYGYALKNLDCDIENATTADIMQALSQDWKTSTAAARQAAIKSFFGWLQDTERIKHNPTDGIGNIRLPDSLPRPIPETDLEKIFLKVKTYPLIPRTYFFLLRDIGCRATEGISLDVEDISWEKGQESIRIKGKGNRERIVPFDWTMDCAQHLKRLCNQQKTGPLFVSQRKERASYFWAYYWWDKTMTACDMDYTIHQLRHTAITNWVNSGINLMAVRRLAGHRLLQTTERYTQISTDDLRKELQKTQ